jgi:predicted alpha-1,2-mannosidase
VYRARNKSEMRNALMLFAACFVLALPAPTRAAASFVPTSLVDTFVGTSGTPVGGPIDTFPGADVPFGMVQWSPDTPSQNAGGGYEYTDHEITGFSLTHLSGPGCNVFGDFAVLPFSGGLPTDVATARQSFSHATEESAPGWYAVSVGTPAIRTELSVTPHTGIARFTFPRDEAENLIFNAASNQAGVTEARVEVDNSREISGSASSGYFCGMFDRYTVYFAARFSRAFATYGSWGSSRRAAWLSFPANPNPQIIVKVGLSFVSVAGARANLDAENRGWSVIAVRNAATERWNGMLDRIFVRGGTPEERRAFYTAFYHTLLHPNVISDASGSYTGFDGRIHRAVSGHAEYANFSDWDIYRTEVPLLALIAPGETSDMMQSLVDAARQENGWLPRWALVNGPTSVMGGDSVDAVIAGAYAFGARDFDARGALAAMVKGASTTAGPPGQGWYIPRWELNDWYLSAGFVANVHTTSVSPGPNGASETLEYALDDFGIARLADALHDRRNYEIFMRRSSNWMTLFNSASRSIEPRDGSMLSMAFMRTPIAENGQSGFQEGNAAQYTWMVPQDLRDLIAAMGGSSSAGLKLDEFFTQLNAGQDKPYAWLGNEPSLGAPWVYLSLGEPWKAQAIVRRALTTLYADTPDGIPGNDDLGTMSAWYVWCAIGLYPQNPAARYLDVGTPLFSSVTLRSPNGSTIQIAAVKGALGGTYVQSLRVNGAPASHPWIALPQRGALRLDVTASETPNLRWGAGGSDAPPSFATVPLSLPPSTAATFTGAIYLRMDAGTSKALDFSIANRSARTSIIGWRVDAPRGLRLERSTDYVTLAAGETGTVSLRLFADASLHAGYYTLLIRGIDSSNGARLDPPPVSIRIDRDGERPEIAYAENGFGNSVTPIDLATGASGPEIAVGEYPRDAALSHDRTRLYVANLGGNSISVIDTERERTIATIKTGLSPNGLALTPDGKTLWFSNGDDGTIQSLDLGTLKAGETIPVGIQPHTIAIAPDGSKLYVSNRGSNTVTPIDLRTRAAEKAIDVAPRPTGIAITPNGKLLYVLSGARNDVTPFDLANDARALTPIPVGVYPMQIAIAPDGMTAYVTNYANSTITPIDLRTNATRAPIEVGGAPYGIAITSDGRKAAIVSHRDNDCVLLDLGSMRPSRPIPLGIGPYTIAAP